MISLMIIIGKRKENDMRIIIDSLTNCTIMDKSQIKIIHVVHPIGDYTLCGDALEEYNFTFTDKQVTCKKCIKIINYCKECRE